jgi:2-polyprenyl-6-methoxyphenol hydroxylase-like FAD-dependent oxidoreductase
VKTLDQPVLVAGAGVGGLTSALALARHGLPVTVFERRTAGEIATATGFGHTIWSNATTSLASLGLGEAVREVGDPLAESENRNSAQQVVFRIRIADTVTPGALPALGIGRGDLVGLLRDACLAHGVQIRYGTAVTGFEPGPGDPGGPPGPAGPGEPITVRLSDGQAVEGAALIGADGIHSTVLGQVHGHVPLVDTGRSTYRGIAPGTCGLRSGVVHLFTDANTGTGGGAWLIGGDRVVWTVSCPWPPRRQEAADEDPERGWASAMALAEVLGEIPRTFVSRTPPGTVTRTHLYYHDWLGSWGTGRVTLLGDAAHAIPTDLGQGACLAIEDGVVLGDVLAAAPCVATGLRTFAERRRPRVRWVRQQVMRAHGFRPVQNPAARWAVTKIAKVVIAATGPKMWREIQRPPELTASAPGRPDAARPVP